MGGVPETPGEVRPEASPADPAPTAAEPFDLGKMEQVWPAVLDSVAASGSGMVASYFDGTRPVKLEDSKLTVGFPADAAFNRRNAERPECLKQLGAALGTVTGDQFRIQYESLDGGQQAVDPEAEAMDEEDFVARVKSEFNAEEVI